MLSILLPVFNGAAYLQEQIASIQEQSFKNWTLFAVDDGSTDESLKILHQRALKDKRISVVPASGNMGQRRRLIELIYVSNGDLVAIADQDDRWAPDKLEILLSGMGTNDVAFGSSWLIDKTGHEIGRDLFSSFPPAYTNGDRLRFLFAPLVSAHALIARRTLLTEVSFSRSIPFDWLISLDAAFGNGLISIPSAKTMHRIHDKNQSNSGLSKQHRARLFSRFELLRFGRSSVNGRLLLMGALEHLEHSLNVDSDARRRARMARKACFETWCGLYRQPQGLAQRLSDILAPLAGSERDWKFAEASLIGLCAPAWSLQRFLARRKRLSF